jgi:hypothetical protein
MGTNELEKAIERYLVTQVTKNGGECFKWVSPQNKGVPDRIVLLNRQVWFIELKRPGLDLTDLQKHVKSKITKHTTNYKMINSKELVDDFIKEVYDGH